MPSQSSNCIIDLQKKPETKLTTRLKKTSSALALFVAASSTILSGAASAQQVNQALLDRINELQNEIQNIKSQLVSPTPQASGSPTPTKTHEYIERKPGDGITFLGASLNSLGFFKP